MSLKRLDVSKNAHEALKALKAKKGGVKLNVLVDEILINVGLLNKDGSVKDK